MTAKVTLTIQPLDFYANGGQSVAKIVTRAYQGGAEIASVVTPYDGTWPIQAVFQDSPPNGDTIFKSQALNSSDQPIGPENAGVFMNVNKTLVQIPGNTTAQ